MIAYNMQREALRTVESLSRRYQQGSEEVDYELVVVDNASPEPLNLEPVGDIGVPLVLVRRNQARVSPADAINIGVARSSGDYVAVMIDGARMLSPGVVRGTADAIRLASQPVVAVLGLHLGPAHQRVTVEQGYSKKVEDQLLDSIHWPAHGYKLFEIAAWGGSCAAGWLGIAAESNCICVSRRLYDALGGYDEGFEMPGGGLVNLDFYKRAVEHPDSSLIYLAGEGCFHQLHGGVTTGKRQQGHSFEELNEEYRQLRGEGFTPPTKQPLLFGKLNPMHAPALLNACEKVLQTHPLTTVQEKCAPFLAGSVGSDHPNPDLGGASSE
ncbi:glycosyltransferase family 2 protein [Tamilnaduibacter salinus]|uniref:glycosyltransferase family 2 protein n=1 Tax=Tamilnaduibacter salinus TaxID=1484056 RepID=UPI0013044BA3|nr:glycosyltransferase [Tamilnaduibacter salinus]